MLAAAQLVEAGLEVSGTEPEDPDQLSNARALQNGISRGRERGGATCPADSVLGTSRLDTRVPGLGGAPGPSLAGTLYNAELLGNEPGRLAVITPGVPGVSSIPFYITPRAGGDYGLTGVLTDIARLDAVNLGPPFGVQNLQVSGLSFFINASTKYVRNPTSCKAQDSTGQAVGYDDPTTVTGPTYTFTTVGCATVPFGPSVAMSLGDRGTTKFNGNPPLTVKITAPPGGADIQNTKILLPI